jgi:catechol 2,3-dioxygenase-like lactoylglutathione lyase family enzyme
VGIVVPCYAAAPAFGGAGFLIWRYKLMFDVLSIFVTDMGRSLAFYRALGLEIPSEADDAPHAEYELPSGFTLMWDTREMVGSYDPGFAAAGPTGSTQTMELAFRLPAPADVDSRCAALAAAGYATHLAPFDAPWGQRYASVVDPDGHHVALYAPVGADAVNGAG